MKKFIIGFAIIFILILVLFWFHKEKKSQILKIGFVTDWEYQQISTEEKDNHQAKNLLSKAIAHYNYLFKPTVVVGGGDHITQGITEKTEESLDNLKEIIPIFNKLKAHKIFVLGKKDYQPETLEQVKSILNIQETYYSQVYKNIRIVVLDSTQNDKSETALGTIDQKQIKWLKEEFKKPEPIVIFSHHSPLETPNKDIWRQNLTNQEEIQEIIKENNEKIIAVVSGNSNQDYITKKSGVPYIIIGGLVNKRTMGRFSEITSERDKENPNIFEIKIKNQGENQSTYKIKRNLASSTKTKISLIEENLENKKKKWFDVEDKENPQGVLSDHPSGEPNLNITENGTLIVAYQNNGKADKIQVKIFKDNQWQNLSDENYPEGLVSLGQANNPRIITKNEDIYLTFTELDYDKKSRLLKWSAQEQKWQELSTGGFVSDKSAHEPILTFDKDKKNLYVAYAEIISPTNNQKQIKIKKWDGENWQEIPAPFYQLAQFSGSSLDEIELKASNVDDSIYLAYEEQTSTDKNIMKVKKLVDSEWKDLSLDVVYKNQITQVNGFSPSLAIDKQENVYLSFVENNQNKVHIYKYNQKQWADVSPANQTGTAIEPFITINNKDNLFLGYSEFKKDIVMFKKSEKDFIKTGAWRVRVQKFKNGQWTDCADDFNYGGYITKGSGKGDPALATFQENLFVVVSDEENDYAVRVKKYTE